MTEDMADAAEPKKGIILVVDDEPSVCTAIKRALRTLPVLVQTASSGVEALNLLRKNVGVFLIISDFTMPEMNGVAFLEEAKAINPDAFRILLTATGTSEQAIGWMESGLLHRYVAKPWDNERLRSTVQTLMRKSRIRSH